MQPSKSVLSLISRAVSSYLEKPLKGYKPFTPSDPETLRACLQPGDVLLVEGNQRVSAAIKYLTQSTWSHAALYVGDALVRKSSTGEPCDLVEADVKRGVIGVSLSKYEPFNTRICRPVGLTADDRQKVIDYAIAHIGDTYDLANVFDLLRYLLPTPPVPVRLRRHMLALGSGDPTRAICSTLIAQAFQTVRYPILPLVSTRDDPVPRVRSTYSRDLVMHIRHHSLFVPRDFDVSPFFRVVKPTIEHGFDYRDLIWAHDPHLNAQASMEALAARPADPGAQGLT